MEPDKRLRIEIEGIVQGVGFRPFVYRLAHELGVSGWVRNRAGSVEIEAEGSGPFLDDFLRRLPTEAPPLARITALRSAELPLRREREFRIATSEEAAGEIQIAPDGDVCPDCLRELFDPADRRYRYPFITCTNCGPRYSIITGVPYDRLRTTMADFAMCAPCRAEYENPADRRFHAQPIACPVCGPQLRLLDREGRELPGEPIAITAQLLKAGRIGAIKGIGGYHLAVDPENTAAVAELRRRKRRDEKPFALMAPDLAAVRQHAFCDTLEEKLLCGPECPIVLLRKRKESSIAPLVAPANGWFGFMLPSAPLHHLLLRDQFAALVMTSANLSDEPIIHRDDEAMEQLSGIADFFLVHNRPIQTRLDDSVLRVFRGEPLFLRRSRGYVPRGIRIPFPAGRVLAVGAELKSTVCLTSDDRAFLSRHIGDLQNAATLAAFDESIRQLQEILAIAPDMVAHDLHPDYLSTGYAEELPDVRRVPVQHHHAHLAACMAENRLDGQVIGVIFDGTGYGPDGTVWGGEFLVGGYAGYQRRGHFMPLPLPGGDAAVREPLRMAMAWLHAIYGPELFALPLTWLQAIPEGDRKLYRQILERRINSPLTSSCGRLFDAAAALLGVRQRVSYEGQAAIELEGVAEQSSERTSLPFTITQVGDTHQLDFRPMGRTLVEEIMAGKAVEDLARRFHATVAAAAAEVCTRLRAATGLDRVVLSGGVFQNRLLTEELCSLLEALGFQVFVHRLVPPNDGGIALGQAMIAAATTRKKQSYPC